MKKRIIIKDKRGTESNRKRGFFPLFLFLFSVILVAALTFFDTKAYKDAKMMQDIVIVIDAGHGGNDPGKISSNGIMEKDVNLEITKKLQKELVSKGFKVILTRENDNDLSDFDACNKKKSDMKNRVTKINSSNADYTISIHQNSYSDPSVKGAQVFYYSSSEKSKELAAEIQEEIKKTVDENNNRMIKEGNDYYILRKTNCPGVIIECGFLSCDEEAARLVDEKYQMKLVKAIANCVENVTKNKESANSDSLL